MLDIEEAKNFFTAANEKHWTCTSAGHRFDVHDGILSFYRRFGCGAHNGLTYLGLPLSHETAFPDHPDNHARFQRFERGVVCYDPDHTFDNPPGSGDVYMMHLDRVAAVPEQ